MECVIKKSILRRVIKGKLPDGVRQSGSDGENYITDYLQHALELIMDEAVKSNYYKLKEIDWQRGIDKFEKSIIEDRTGKAFPVIERLLSA